MKLTWSITCKPHFGPSMTRNKKDAMIAMISILFKFERQNLGKPKANTFIDTSITKIIKTIVWIIHKLYIKWLQIDPFKPHESSSDISYYI